MIATTLVTNFLQLLDAELPKCEPSEKKALLDELEDITNILDDYLVNKHKESIKVE